MDEFEARLRRALHGSSEDAPRPVTPIELPLKLEHLVTPLMLKALRPASVLVPVVRRAGGHRVLLTVRSSDLRSHKGQISFPGGRREEGDGSAAAAALREAHEEVGLPPDAVEVIGYLDDYPTVTRYLVTPVVGVVEDGVETRACAREVAEIFEVPLPFVLDRSSYEKKSLTQAGVSVPYLELNYGPYRIWGATAGMLWNLAEKAAAHG